MDPKTPAKQLALKPRAMDLSFSESPNGFTPMKLQPSEDILADTDDDIVRQRTITADDLRSSMELFNPDLDLTPSSIEPRTRSDSSTSSKTEDRRNTNIVSEESDRLHKFLDQVHSEMQQAEVTGQVPRRSSILSSPRESEEEEEDNDQMVENLKLRMQRQKQNELDLAAAEWSVQKRNIYELQDDMDNRVSALQREVVELRHQLAEAEDMSISLRKARQSLEVEKSNAEQESKVALELFEKAKTGSREILCAVDSVGEVASREKFGTTFVKNMMILSKLVKNQCSWMFPKDNELPDLSRYAIMDTWKAALEEDSKQGPSFDPENVLARVSNCETGIENLKNVVAAVASTTNTKKAEAERTPVLEQLKSDVKVQSEELKSQENGDQSAVAHLRNVIQLLHAENLRLDTENQRLSTEREEYHKAYLAATNEVTHVRQHGEQLYKLFKGYRSQYLEVDEVPDPKGVARTPEARKGRTRGSKPVGEYRRSTRKGLGKIRQNANSQTRQTPTHRKVGGSTGGKLRPSDLEENSVRSDDQVGLLEARVHKLKHTLKRIFVWGQRESEARNIAEEELRNVKQLLRRVSKADRKEVDARSPASVRL